MTSPGAWSDDAVADDDTHDIDIAVGGEFSQDACWYVDGDGPFGVGAGCAGCVGVDDDDIFGPASPACPCGAADESGEGVAGQEFLFLDRVGRAVLGDCFGEQGVDGAFQRGCELHAGERVEGAAQVPHAVGVGPGGEPDVGLLALETIETVTGLQAFDFELESTPEFIDGARCGDCSEVVRAVEELRCVGRGPVVWNRG